MLSPSTLRVGCPLSQYSNFLRGDSDKQVPLEEPISWWFLFTDYVAGETITISTLSTSVQIKPEYQNSDMDWDCFMHYLLPFWGYIYVDRV